VGQAVSIDFIVARLAKHALELASLWSSGKNATANYIGWQTSDTNVELSSCLVVTVCEL
jgi:hypothetical protein